MKEIKYKLIEDGISTTPCPYGQGNKSIINKVGAWTCEKCRFFIASNDKDTVICKYGEEPSEPAPVHKYIMPDTIFNDKTISADLYNRLEYLGIIDESGVRGRNFGSSDYNEHTITVWSIWLDYPNLSEFEKMIIKYTLRKKDTDPKKLDMLKVKHYADEVIRQIDVMEKQNK